MLNKWLKKFFYSQVCLLCLPNFLNILNLYLTYICAHPGMYYTVVEFRSQLVSLYYMNPGIERKYLANGFTC